MITIWKYELEIGDTIILNCPKGALPRCVQLQHGKPCLWMQVDDTQPGVIRKIQVRGTGHNLDDAGEYLGTFQQLGGDFIGHVFDGGEQT